MKHEIHNMGKESYTNYKQILHTTITYMQTPMGYEKNV